MQVPSTAGRNVGWPCLAHSLISACWLEGNIKLGDIYVQLLPEKLSEEPCHPLRTCYVGISRSLLEGRSLNELDPREQRSDASQAVLTSSTGLC